MTVNVDFNDHTWKCTPAFNFSNVATTEHTQLAQLIYDTVNGYLAGIAKREEAEKQKQREEQRRDIYKRVLVNASAEDYAQ